MAVIYGGSYLVIAATQAAGCDEGFLQREEISEPRITAYDERTAHQYDSDRGSTEFQLVGSPLFQRGWCFQEHMLAARVLHFGKLELVFHCRIGRKCECGQDADQSSKRQFSFILDHLDTSIPPIINGEIPQRIDDPSQQTLTRSQEESLRHRFRWFKAKIHDKYLKGKLYHLETHPLGCSLKAIRFGEMWADIIQDYSPLRFIFDRDTLSALSGLVNLTRVYSPGRYLAGLWERIYTTNWVGNHSIG
jgi:hypothetical protein